MKSLVGERRRKREFLPLKRSEGEINFAINFKFIFREMISSIKVKVISLHGDSFGKVSRECCRSVVLYVLENVPE